MLKRPFVYASYIRTTSGESKWAGIFRLKTIKNLGHATHLCEATGLPIILHSNSSSLNLNENFPEIRPREILTHGFQTRETSILNCKGNLGPETRKTIECQILCDLYHESNFFPQSLYRHCYRKGFCFSNPSNRDTRRNRNSETRFLADLTILDLNPKLLN